MALGEAAAGPTRQVVQGRAGVPARGSATVTREEGPAEEGKEAQLLRHSLPHSGVRVVRLWAPRRDRRAALRPIADQGTAGAAEPPAVLDQRMWPNAPAVIRQAPQGLRSNPNRAVLSRASTPQP